MNNIVAAIDVMIALMQLKRRLDLATKDVETKIQGARQEGRDLTDEELEAIRSKREEAMSRWDDLTSE